MSSLNGRGLRTVSPQTAANTITAGDCGTTFTNEGATAARLFSLPAATVGLWYTFIVKANFELQIDPNGTETIALPTGAQQAAGKYVGADLIGERLEIECVKAGEWDAKGVGTWTAQS